jgi:hypothetical protein
MLLQNAVPALETNAQRIAKMKKGGGKIVCCEANWMKLFARLTPSLTHWQAFHFSNYY